VRPSGGQQDRSSTGLPQPGPAAGDGHHAAVAGLLLLLLLRSNIAPSQMRACDAADDGCPGRPPPSIRRTVIDRRPSTSTAAAN